MTGLAWWGTDRSQNYDCAPLRREIGRVRHIAQVGQIAAMHEWIAQSGKTADDFLQGERALGATEASAASDVSRCCAGQPRCR
jgi:hypothetical protein